MQDDKHKEIMNILLFSSLIFTTNALTAFYNGYYIYSLLFCTLTTTSLMFHSNAYTIFITKPTALIIDKVAVMAIVLYGGYMLYNKIEINKQIQVCIIVSTFVLVIFLYFYGYCTNSYCYYPDKCMGDKYHSLLHIISSIGHHLVIFL